MKKQVCKDCYYAGFDKCDHVKKLTKPKNYGNLYVHSPR